MFLGYRVHENGMDLQTDRWTAQKHNDFKNSTGKVKHSEPDDGWDDGGGVEVGAINRNASNSGLSQSSHFNLCPGGWRNQCTLILQTSAWLRIEKHYLSEIRLVSSSSWQGTANRHTNTCIHTCTESLKCTDHNPRGEWSGGNTLQIGQILVQ